MFLFAKRDLHSPSHESQGKPAGEGYRDEILNKFLVVIPSKFCDEN
jgi:hypothetical protein